MRPPHGWFVDGDEMTLSDVATEKPLRIRSSITAHTNVTKCMCQGTTEQEQGTGGVLCSDDPALCSSQLVKTVGLLGSALVSFFSFLFSF